MKKNTPSRVEIINEDKRPKIICSRCKVENLIDITPFAADASKILQDRCRSCGGKMFVGVLIIGDRTFNGVGQAIVKMVSAVNSPNVIMEDYKRKN